MRTPYFNHSGFQYDWTARKYPQTFSQEKPHTTPPPRPVPEQIFPPNLSSVVKTIISSLAHQSVTSSAPELNMTIEPEASIVNYCMVRFPLSLGSDLTYLSLSRVASWEGMSMTLN
jgi:hypothetical protein